MNRFFRIFLGTILSFSICASLSSCVLAPIMDSVESTGAFQADREMLLYKELKKFHNSRFWGNAGDISSFLHPESSPGLATLLSPRKKEERITDSEVLGVVFSNDSYEAEVELEIKGYRYTTMVISARQEKQVWRFSMSSGWKLLSLHSINS